MDRDGTLIEDGPFLSNPDGIRFLDGTFDALKQLQGHGFLLVLITNQSGVGRGYFSEKTLEEIHLRLKLLLKEQRIALDAIYYCPHGPEVECMCRKPNSGMFRKAIRDLSIDPLKSYAIGDKQEDALAAKQVGCKAILLRIGSSPVNSPFDFLAPNLSLAVDWILKNEKGKG